MAMKTFHLIVPKPIKGSGVHRGLIERIAATGRQIAAAPVLIADELFILPWDWDGTLSCDVDLDQAEYVTMAMEKGMAPRFVTVEVDLIEFVDPDSGYRGAMVRQIMSEWTTQMPLLRILTTGETANRSADATDCHKLGAVGIDWREPLVQSVEKAA